MSACRSIASSSASANPSCESGIDQRALAAELAQLGQRRRQQRVAQLAAEGDQHARQRQRIMLPLAAATATPRRPASDSCRAGRRRPRPAQRGSSPFASTRTERIFWSLAPNQRCRGRKAGITSRSSCGRLCRVNRSPQPCGMTSVTNSGAAVSTASLSAGAPPARTRKSCGPARSAGTGSRRSRGNSLRPSTSTTRRPRKSDRSSSTACAVRARLATTRITSPSYSRR